MKRLLLLTFEIFFASIVIFANFSSAYVIDEDFDSEEDLEKGMK